ncbi:hypothetical protein BT67DRAFT_437930, partial [Trichocladium antarcticum]
MPYSSLLPPLVVLATDCFQGQEKEVSFPHATPSRFESRTARGPAVASGTDERQAHGGGLPRDTWDKQAWLYQIRCCIFQPNNGFNCSNDKSDGVI